MTQSGQGADPQPFHEGPGNGSRRNYVATSEARVSEETLRSDLGSLLQPYTSPNRYIISGESAKNANRKVDRAPLKKL